MKKILIIIPFLSVLLLFSSFSVKANDFAFPAFPEPVEGKSSTHYLISFDSETGSYFLIKPRNPQAMYVTIDGNELFFKFSEPAISYSWTGEGDTSWVKVSEYNYLTDLRIHGYNEGTEEFLYSSFDLFNSDGELFFQRAPIRESFLAQMKKVEMGAMMKTVVYLIPLLIVLLVSFLAFRKALAWLLKVLRKA